MYFTNIWPFLLVYLHHFAPNVPIGKLGKCNRFNCHTKLTGKNNCEHFICLLVAGEGVTSLAILVGVRQVELEEPLERNVAKLWHHHHHHHQQQHHLSAFFIYILLNIILCESDSGICRADIIFRILVIMCACVFESWKLGFCIKSIPYAICLRNRRISRSIKAGSLKCVTQHGFHCMIFTRIVAWHTERHIYLDYYWYFGVWCVSSTMGQMIVIDIG